MGPGATGTNPGANSGQAINEQIRRSLSQLGRIADIQILENALRMIADGRRIFRSDTFGDEAFWGDHDGRFKTLLDVVNHYDIHFILGLTDGEKSDLVEYLKSL